MSKKTIVTGCSWTQRDYKSYNLPEIDTSWKKWDEYLGDAYGWDIINTAVGGNGNEVILDAALDMIYNNDVERCVIALSEWGRFRLPSGDNINPNLTLWDNSHNVSDNHKRRMKFFELYPYNHRMHREMVTQTLFRLYKFIDVCREKNIEVIIVQMIDSIESFKFICSQKEWVKVNNFLLSNQYFTKIEKQMGNDNIKIMGWPFVHDLGGFNINNMLRKVMGDDSWAIHPTLDPHPSAEGHKEIANIIMEWYNDLD